MIGVLPRTAIWPKTNRSCQARLEPVDAHRWKRDPGRNGRRRVQLSCRLAARSRPGRRETRGASSERSRRSGPTPAATQTLRSSIEDVKVLLLPRRRNTRPLAEYRPHRASGDGMSAPAATSPQVDPETPEPGARTRPGALRRTPTVTSGSEFDHPEPRITADGVLVSARAELGRLAAPTRAGSPWRALVSLWRRVAARRRPSVRDEVDHDRAGLMSPTRRTPKDGGAPH